MEYLGASREERLKNKQKYVQKVFTDFCFSNTTVETQKSIKKPRPTQARNRTLYVLRHTKGTYFRITETKYSFHVLRSTLQKPPNGSILSHAQKEAMRELKKLTYMPAFSVHRIKRICAQRLDQGYLSMDLAMDVDNEPMVSTKLFIEGVDKDQLKAFVEVMVGIQKETAAKTEARLARREENMQEKIEKFRPEKRQAILGKKKALAS